MNYASIRTCDIANGEGVRVSLFVSGCTHHCRGCFNEEAQAFDYGEPFTREVEDSILTALEPGFIAGLTLLGGEPMEPENQRVLVPFLRRFRERFGATKTLWVYTGCVWEKLGSRNEEFGMAEGSFYLSEAQLHWFGLVRIPVYFVLFFYRMGECIDKK